MRSRRVLLAVAVLAVGLLVASLAVAAGGKKKVKADQLTGYQENPDISSVASGSFKATLDDDAQTITYELTYSGLEGTVTQAHIHFGKRAVNGGITVFLCGTAASPGPAGTPTCPAEGTVSRTVTAADILAPATASGPRASRRATTRSSPRRYERATRTRTSTPRSGRAGRFARRSTTATPTTDPACGGRAAFESPAKAGLSPSVGLLEASDDVEEERARAGTVDDAVIERAGEPADVADDDLAVDGRPDAGRCGAGPGCRPPGG